MSSQHKEEFVQLDFVVIGSRKCATTWLYELFLKHPQVCVSETVKQSGFFCTYFDRGLRWYTKLFRDWHDKIVGEVDPDIMTCTEAPARIRSLFPNVKIIAIFRNPPDLFFSSYEHSKRKGDISDTPEEVWNSRAGFKTEVGYGTMLQRLYDVFPREQVLVLLYEDIENKASVVLDQVSTFLGLSSAFDTQLVHSRVNPSRVARNVLFSKVCSRTARVARKLGMHGLVNVTKQLPFVKKNYKISSRDELQNQRSGSLRLQIMQDLQQEMILFGELTGLDLERIWPEVIGGTGTRIDGDAS